MTRIVDTSVVIKWAVAEEGTDRAVALFGEDLVAPSLLKAELANALWKKVRRAEIEPNQAEAAYHEIVDFLRFMPTDGLDHRALEIALLLEHPVYDCYFLALAESTGMIIVTADRRLVSRCGGSPFEQMIEIL